MKNRFLYIIIIILTFTLELSLSIYFINKISTQKEDTVKINECMQSVVLNYGNENNYNKDLDYTILDTSSNVVYKTNNNLSTSINDAIKNNDIILDLKIDDAIVGKILFHNNTRSVINNYKNELIVTISILLFIQLLITFLYFAYIRKSVIKPFNDMNDFALRIAGGNLDIPLIIDKKHIFGSFTESFDIMRSELKKAKINEKKANDEKKEMIAKLSHDIKTPVASIKATSELGYAISKDEKSQNYFNQINIKTDQIKTLVDNLFNSSVNDVTEISVNPSNYNSNILNELINNSDYLNKANKINIPSCTIFIDKLRMQQTLDNIFMNSYKYANTDISVNINIINDYLELSVSDKGSGVSDYDLPLLKEKFKRGSNIKDEDGAGLGLYLSNYFMEHMNGKLELYNDKPGFTVKLYIRTI